MSTLAARPPSLASTAAGAVLAGAGGAEDLHRFLTEEAPELVRAAVTPLLGADGAVSCSVTRSKLKPGRKLTVWGEVVAPGGVARPYAASWAAADGSATPLEDPAPQVALAPTDPLFPHLAGLYDTEHLARRLVAVGQGPIDPGLRVVPVRYRPGQRHVLRVVHSGDRPGYYAKCYRDDAGRRAVTGGRQVAAALAAWGGPVRAARPAGYLEAERTVLWSLAPGSPLSGVVLRRTDLAATAGTALRAVHDSPGVFDSHGSGWSDPHTEVRATTRSAEHVAALDRAVAARFDTLLARVGATLLAVAAEYGHRLHGDFKADNVLAADGGLWLLDFDRVTVGDPALDLGKFLADLRWWGLRSGTSADPAAQAFLDGYGPAPSSRLARARGWDALFQLRALGRRVLLHEPDWERWMDAGLDVVEHTVGSAP